MTRRNGRWWWICVLITLFCLSPFAARAEVLYVQAKSAQLRAGKTSLDPVLTNIRYGEAVEVLSRDGNWTEVKTAGGARGWIFSSKLSASKPPGAGDTLARLGQGMRSGEAPSSTASAGARGLDKASEGYADRAGISPRDREAVDRMTGYQVSDDEVEQFLKEGGLGEYAK